MEEAAYRAKDQWSLQSHRRTGRYSTRGYLHVKKMAMVTMDKKRVRPPIRPQIVKVRAAISGQGPVESVEPSKNKKILDTRLPKPQQNGNGDNGQ